MKRKKMKLLTKEQQESNENIKIWIVVRRKYEIKYVKAQKYSKLRDHCYYTGECRSARHSTCNLEYSIPKKVPIAFHNGSNDDYHFIITELDRRS